MSFVNKGANILFFFNMPFGTKMLIFFGQINESKYYIYKTKLLWTDNNRRQTYSIIIY